MTKSTGSPVQTAAVPDRTAYDLVGGASGIQALVTRFYDLMDIEPAYAHLRSLHGNSLDGAREKLVLFLSGWLGGPDLYAERYGHPRLRARHLPFPIGTRERDDWLACMRQAMDELGVDPRLRTRLDQAFVKTADWMRNQPG